MLRQFVGFTSQSGSGQILAEHFWNKSRLNFSFQNAGIIIGNLEIVAAVLGFWGNRENLLMKGGEHCQYT